LFQRNRLRERSLRAHLSYIIGLKTPDLRIVLNISTELMKPAVRGNAAAISQPRSGPATHLAVQATLQAVARPTPPHIELRHVKQFRRPFSQSAYRF
jgi:hypothetical protein